MREFPAVMPEVNNRPAVERWYEDLKNNLQRELLRIEEALGKMASVDELNSQINNLQQRIESLEGDSGNSGSERFLVFDADVSPEAGIKELKLALNYATHSNVNDPNADQKAALAGSHGTPSGSNRYLTQSALLAAGGVAPNNLPIGAILPFAGTSAPDGFLDCDGSELSREEYADLFSAIEDTWGAGDGSTTFLIPDLRGRALIGAGTGAGLTARTVADTLGEEEHLLTAEESGLPAHNHEFDWRDNTCSAGSDNETGDANGSPTTTVETSAAGPSDADEAHNTMQPSAVVMWIIKYR